MKSIAVIVVAFFLTLACGRIVLAMVRALRRRLSPPPVVCYRCGLILSRVFPYMGLSYCNLCRSVVVAMAWLIPMGAPFGFPGSPGYLELSDVPVDQKDRQEKEVEHHG